MSKLEKDYQRALIKRIKDRFPDCMILKNDANYIQGIPDLIILIGDRWFVLEVKRSKDAPRQPNQEYYVNKLNKMSYSGVIYPENEEEILDEIYKTLQSRR